MSNYVDLHNHILPAIDDGPGSLAESVELARSMVAAGYDTAVATPHTCDGEPGPPLILERLHELQGELKRLQIPLNVLPGSEQHIEPATLERLQQGQLLTLNNSRYFLLELPFFQPLPVYTFSLLANLTAEGYIPVIPHPERALSLQNNPQLVYELHQQGALFQVTWGALGGALGAAARQLVQAMLEANLVHFFATDAHHAETRLLQLNRAASILEELKGADFVTLMLSTRPRQLLANQNLNLEEPRVPTFSPKGPLKSPFLSHVLRKIGY